MRTGETEAVTLRYHRADEGAPVTLRWLADPITPATGQRTPTLLIQGQSIAGRYVIEGEPLAVSGESDVFLCRDKVTGQQRVIKYYRQHAQPKAEVMARLQGLAHPNIVTIRDSGQWHGRFYEILDYCPGGVASDIMPINEIRLRDYLASILGALHYLHGEGIVHRDIKPGNLFFADRSHQRLMLGDFGISSYLDLAESSVRLTQTAACLTLDYAAPELLNYHEVGPMTDYYALGITLLHLLCGRTPFHGMSSNDILVAHLRAELPIPDTLSPPFRTLIAGLTHYQPEERWGYKQAMAWLHGEVVHLAPAPPILNHGIKPYPGLPEVNSPALLAEHLDDIDALQHLLRGDIQRWVFDYFDPKLADAISALEQLAAKNADQALARLPFTLNPKAPLRMGERCIHNLGDLFRALEYPDTYTYQAWNHKAIIIWLKSGEHAGAQTRELVTRLERLYDEHRHSPALALFTLRYILQPALPLHLGSLGTLAEPEALMQLFRQHGKKLIPPLAKLIFNQYFESWLHTVWGRISEPHVKFIRRVRMQYGNNKNVGAYCVLWHFCPMIPLPFDGRHFTQAIDLAQYIGENEQRRQQGLAYLEAGWLAAWLQGTGKLDDAEALDLLLLNATLSPPVILDSLLRLINPDHPRPRMVVQPEFIKLGELQQGDQKSKTMRIHSAGDGWLHGSVQLHDSDHAIMIDTFDFEGKATSVEITVDTVNLTPGRYESSITIRSNAGTQTVPILFTVVEKPSTPWWKGGF